MSRIYTIRLWEKGLENFSLSPGKNLAETWDEMSTSKILSIWENSRRSAAEFTNENLNQIGSGDHELWSESDITTNKQTWLLFI